jgi:hypothetical protein
MEKTITVDTLDMVKLKNGSHNCVAIFKAVLDDCIRITGVKLFNDPTTDKWWLKFPINESNHKKLPYFSFVNSSDYQYLLECAKNEYQRSSNEEEAFMG